MDSEGIFWVNVWRVVGIAVVCVASVGAGCQSYQTHAVKSMVANGADPLRAACAVASGADRQVCAVVGAQAVGKP